MSTTQKTFKIAEKINEHTGLPFGDKYAEPVLLRRPTTTDRIMISVRQTGVLSAYGANPAHIPQSITTLAYIHALIGVLTNPDNRPDWTKPENCFEEDEAAIYALFDEVSLWLDTFRPTRSEPQG